jgi:putative FmdB family regulatory protein
MPVYEYRCPKHGGYEAFMPMSECNEGKCPRCGQIGMRLFSDCHVYVDFTPGFDHSLNTYVATKQQRDRICEEKGLKRYKD